MMKKKQNPRIQAAQILQRVLKEGAYTNRLIDHLFSEEGWDPRDRNLLLELVYGILRHLSQIDCVLDRLAKQGIHSLNPTIVNPLRIAIYEILFLERIPHHASISEAVKTIKKKHGPQLAGFANAILRRLVRERDFFLLHDPLNDLTEELAHSTSHPQWLVEHYIERIGLERTQERLQLHNQPAPITLCVNRQWGSREDLFDALQKRGIACEKTQFSPDGIRLSSPLTKPLQELFAEFPDAFVVQDEAAQILALWLNPTEKDEVLDACAAPGGKTVHLAALAPKASVEALDIHEHKIRLIEKNYRRLNLSNIRTRLHDATQPIGKKYDKILLDAPCSGLGILRKHPEIRYRRSKEQFAKHAALQLELLQNLAEHLPPKGRLLFSVCTDTSEENEQVIQQFLATHPNFQKVPPPPDVPWASLIDEDLFLRTAPELHQMDAFFAVLLEKIN